MRQLSLFIILAFNILYTNAQSIDKDQMVQQFLDTSHGSGIAVGIIHNGRTEIITKGNLSKGGKEKVDRNTLFEIGSVTKTFTATLAASLVNAGQLTFQDSLSMFFPADERELRYQGRAITLLNLLQHTSGLPRIPDNLLSANEDISDPYLTYNRDSMEHFFAHYHPTVRPGDTFGYSNLGYGVMGEVMAMKEHADYNSLIQQYICGPLDMKNTHVALSPEELKKLATGYTADSVAHYWHFADMAGAGGLHSDLDNMLKFVGFALETLKESTFGSNRMLRNAINTCVHKTTSIENSNAECGIGWIVSPLNGHHLYWHNGGTLGFSSFIGVAPDEDFAIVVLSNSDALTDPLAIKLLKSAISESVSNSRR
jgi:CubicO group peptidase (beta-lactamase class C family)